MVVHRTSGNALLCPESVLVCRVLYIRKQGAAPSQNLATFKRGGHWVNIMLIDISRMLKDAVRFLDPSLGLIPKDVSVKYLCTVGLHSRSHGPPLLWY